MQTADATLDLSDRIVPPLDRGQRLFRIALAAAFLLHAALFIEVGRSLPRTIGDKTGAPDAIAVDLVSAADLASRETVAMPPAGAPTAQPPTPAPEVPPQPAEAAPPPPAPAQTEPKPVEPVPPAPAEKQAEAPPPAETKAAEKAETPALPKDFASELPDLATMPQPSPDPPAAPEPSPKAADAAPPADAAAPPKSEQAQAKKKAQKQARLDPAPPDVRSAPPGRSASATRPPGITRSGENDEFGRGVVRALRMTMPPPRGIMGRVTVRLILTPNGDLKEVRVLDPSRTVLDQSVVFATQQTYFPLPPHKSTVADRTFVITYVYR